MSAPENNQFWKQRSKHGRDTLFASAELMWGAACEYFSWCDEHPFHESEAKVTSNGGDRGGSSVELVEIPKMRAYTMTGLCLYIGCNETYFRQFNTKDKPDFKKVIDEIEKTVYEQKFTGAASGFFNATIIARDLGLKDSSDITTGGEKINNIPPQINVYNTAPPLARNEGEIDSK